MYQEFQTWHKEAVSGVDEGKDKVKNILNCFLHFYLFQSMSSAFIFDLLHVLLHSYSESDLEILIFLLHNIGLQLRKSDPAALKSILDLAE